MATEMINGNRLFYEVVGEGPPLILVHGSWGDHNNWMGVVPQLAESYAVVTFDRRGHSQSDAPAGQGSVNDDVADLQGLINELQLTPAHIVGNSLGASIVLRTAYTHPGLFRSMAVHEPPLMAILAGDPAFADIAQKNKEAIGRVVGLLERGQNPEAAELFFETVALGPGAWEQMPPPVRETIVSNAPTFLDEMRDPETFLMNLEALGAFPHPVLLSYGEQSAPFFPAIVARLARAMPFAQVYAYADAGHLPHVSHPEPFVKTLTGFLETVDA